MAQPSQDFPKKPATDTCNAKSTKGYCKNLAGAGTPHPGSGRCEKHGGLGGRPKVETTDKDKTEEINKLWAIIPVDSKTFFDKFLHEPCYPEQQKFVDKVLGVNPLEWNDSYTEGIALVGKGGGKDRTISKILTYAIYKLLCMKNPQKMLGLHDNDLSAPEAAIDIGNVSLNARLAQSVFFKNFVAMIKNTTNPKTNKNWFKEQGLNLDKDILKKEVQFPKAITAYSLDSVEYTGEGLNLLLVIFDEVGGFEPAAADRLYGALTSTQKTRFGEKRKTLLLSYKRDDNDFMMVRYNEAKKERKTFRVKAATWDWNIRRKKQDFADDYLKNPEEAKRVYECGGTTSEGGYFKYRDRIKESVNPNRVNPLVGEVLWTNDLLKLRFKDFFIPIKYQSYFVHIDLAKGKESGDYLGLALGHPVRNKTIKLNEKYVEDLRKTESIDFVSTNLEKQISVVIDLVLQVRARPGEEIIFDEVREFIHGLKKVGYNIKMVTFDGWQCNLGKNKIKLLNNQVIRIDEITKPEWLYSYDRSKKKIVPALCKPARKTGEKVPVYNVTLDNGETVGFTPDHKLLMRDGTYKQVIMLEPGDSLMPLYKKYALPYKRVDGTVRKYEQVHNLNENSWEFTHNIVAKSCYGKKPKNTVVHHKDFNPLNNSPDNLVYVNVKKHIALHKELTRRRWAKPGEREKQAVLMTERNKKFSLPALLKPPTKKIAKKIAKIIRGKWINDKDYISRMKKRPVYFGKQSSHYNDNIKIETINSLLKTNPSLTLSKLASKLDCSKKLIRSRIEENFKIHKTNIFNNHKVIKVEFAGYEDVYDIEVPGTNNFALDAGIFVHNSVDSIQLLNKIGMKAELLSTDRNTKAYDTLKEQMYKGLLDIYKHAIFIRECEELIRKKNNKIDHPDLSFRRSIEEGRKQGSKDVSDGVAGCTYLCIEHGKSNFSFGVTGLDTRDKGFGRPDDDEKDQLVFYGQRP